MLSRKENESLTRVGPGTLMGNLFRRFWLPLLLAEELPEPDGAPVRTTVLGEELVAFRDSTGTVGFINAYCPHRRAPLFFGRNEECGLRCVYHGWKFDVGGRCVDLPCEPGERKFKEKVKVTAYPSREWGGIIWIYMGPPELEPELPQFEWARQPEDQRYVSKRFLRCNFVQIVESLLDSSHVSYLHSRLPGVEDTTLASGTVIRKYAMADQHPKFLVHEKDYGLLVGARRDAGDDAYYWRNTPWMMPMYTMVPTKPGTVINCTAQTPINDEATWSFAFNWHPDRPLTEDEIAFNDSGGGAHPRVIPGTFMPEQNRENDYLIDRQKQRTVTFTGIFGIRTQDLAMIEAEPINDRTKENLGSSDTAILQMRRYLMKAARDLQRGVEPPQARHGDLYQVSPRAVVLPRDAPFDEDARKAPAARL